MEWIIGVIGYVAIGAGLAIWSHYDRDPWWFAPLTTFVWPVQVVAFVLLVMLEGFNDDEY